MIQTAVRHQRVGLAFLVISALLLLSNVRAFVRNQTGAEFTNDDKLEVRPRSIAVVAKQHLMSVVNTTFATYHAMRLHLRGKHLRLPADMAGSKFMLERAAQVAVEVAPTRLELPREVAQHIFDSETNELWAFAPGTFTGALLDRSTQRYVVVWRRGDNGLQVVIPEDRYQRELASIARGSP